MRVRAVVARVVHSLGLRGSVDIEETEDEIRATVNGDDLGLLIGKHGLTIDALQHLAFRAAYRGTADRKQVTIDAAGYRERRREVLERQAEDAAERVEQTGQPVALDAMSAIERKVVHEHLKERGGVETWSEGQEPDRHLVVAPLS